MTIPRFLQTLRAHPFLVLAVAGVLAGGGLRFAPASHASPGTTPSASTACAAT